MQQAIREKAVSLVNSKLVKGFYSTLITKQMKTSLSEVEDVLAQLVQEGVIKRKHQLLCDNCLRQLDLVDNAKDFQQEYSCYIAEKR